MSKLVLIHGFLGTADDWANIRRRLDYAAEAIDIPEASDWNSGIDVLAAQLPKPSVLVGYSMGARIALGCALSYSQCVRALVLVSGSPGLSNEVREKRWMHDQRVGEELSRLPIERFLRRWYRQEVFCSLTDAQIESLIEDKRDLDKSRFVELMKCYSIAKQPNYWDRLGELTVPVLLVAGQRDPKYVDICRQMQRLMPQARLHLVEEAGHIVHRERPEQFAAMLNGLMSELSKENAWR